MLRTVVATVCLCSFDIAVAAPVPLSGQSLSEMISGAVVELDTPLGTKLSITYGDDGRMTGQAGALAFYLGASRDKGKWWVASDQLCQKWETWFNTETQCMRIKKEGPRIHWASRDGKTGTGTVQLRVAAAPEAARAVKKAVTASVAGPSVEARATATKPAIAAARTEPVKPSLPKTAKAVEKSPQKPTEQPVEIVTDTVAAFVPAGGVGEVPEAVPSAPTFQPRPLFSRLTAPYFAPMSLVQAPDVGAEVAHRDAPVAAARPAVQPAEGAAPDTTAVVKDKVEAKPAAKIEVKSPRPLQTAAKLPPPQPADPLFKVVNVRSSDVLNIRGGPSGDYEVVGAIAPSGRGVAITGECRSQWCPVKHQDVNGWVRKNYLESEEDESAHALSTADFAAHDNPEAPRGCLSSAAKELLGRIEGKFGAMQLVSTCRSGATIAGTGRPSRHRDGNAIDFKAGARKQAVVDWLVANHAQGGTMTYRDMDHIHIDIGPHFVALGSSGRSARDWSAGRMGVTSAR